MNHQNDETSVRSLYERMMEGWNEGDAEAFAEPFTKDADFVAFDGTRCSGKPEIVSSHQPLFDKWLKGSRLTGEIKDVRFLSGEVAVMHATGGTIMSGKSKPSPERDSIQTLVAVKRNGVWRMAAFHNTRVRPIGRNAFATFIWLFSDWLWKLARGKNEKQLNK